MYIYVYIHIYICIRCFGLATLFYLNLCGSHNKTVKEVLLTVTFFFLKVRDECMGHKFEILLKRPAWHGPY